VVEHLLRVLGNRFVDSINSYTYLLKNLKNFSYTDENRHEKGGSSKSKN